MNSCAFAVRCVRRWSSVHVGQEAEAGARSARVRKRASRHQMEQMEIVNRPGSDHAELASSAVEVSAQAQPSGPSTPRRLSLSSR